MRRAILIGSLIIAPALVTAAAPTCWNFLRRNTYGNGPGGSGGSFVASDICTAPPCGASTSASYGVTVSGGQIQLTPVPHDVNNIRLPYDQDVYLQFIGTNPSTGTYGKASHTLDWFYYDTSAPQMGDFLQGGVGPHLIDRDGDTIMDFFQNQLAPIRPRNGLYSRYDNLPSPGASDLANAYTPRSAGAPTLFTDGGRWPRIPNMIEQFTDPTSATAPGGTVIWHVTDDDNDASAYTSLKNGAILMPLTGDQGGTQNGAPDYDANGDGIVDNDGVTAMGQVTGGREFLFHLNSYVDYTSQAQTMGQPANQNYSAPSMGTCTSWNFPGCSSNGQVLWNYPGCTFNGQCLQYNTGSIPGYNRQGNNSLWFNITGYSVCLHRAQLNFQARNNSNGAVSNFYRDVYWYNGWCSICGGSYACTNGYSGVAKPQTFSDPVPGGWTILNVQATLWHVGCGGGTGTFYINGVALANWGNSTYCACWGCETKSMTYTVPSTCTQVCSGQTCSCQSYNSAPGGGWWRETYWDSQATKMAAWFGQPAVNWPVGYWDTSYDSPVGNYFTKQMLNSDRSLRDSNGNPIGLKNNVWDAGLGSYRLPGVSLTSWLTAQQSSRLASGTYGVSLTPETIYPRVQSQNYAPGGLNYYPPHALLGANSTGANRNAWILGFEDLPLAMAWCNSPFYTCKTPGTWNGLVFRMLSEEGGSAVSSDLSGDCAKYPSSCINSGATITKVFIDNFNPSFGAGCSAAARAAHLTRADLYYSIDNGATWHLVVFPAGSKTTLIDTISQGYYGYQLRWKVNMVTAQTDSNCVITLPTFNVGYQAIAQGSGANYQGVEGIPMGNVLVRAQYEGASGGEPRGHVYMHRMYNPDNNNTADSPMLKLWDAGQQLASTSPGLRSIYFFDANAGNAARRFTDAIAANNPGDFLWTKLNPFNSSVAVDATSVNRGCPKVDGRCVYDFAGGGSAPYRDNNVDIKDAIAVARWTLGFLDFNAPTPAVGQPWKLGGIYHSSPVVVTPPYDAPGWLKGTSALLNTWKTAYNAWILGPPNQKTRKTLTIVGAGDGLIHAFDSGYFQWGEDPTTATSEAHGYFAKQGGNRLAGVNQSYGSGNEVWAVAPPSQLPLLRNNVALNAGYKAAENPRATMDGGLDVADIYYGGTFHTVVFAGDGETYPHDRPNPTVVPPSPYTAFGTRPSSAAAWMRRSRYLTAVDVTSVTAPAAVWSTDWTDPDFWGAIWRPSVKPAITTLGAQWLLAVSSGVAATTSTQHLYLINAATGTTIDKVGLSSGMGIYGTPVMVDFTSGNGSVGEGLVDRVYIADTVGRLWRVATKTGTACMLGNAGGTVYAQIAVSVNPKTEVDIYVPTGSDPNTLTAPGATYRLVRFRDTQSDPTTCAVAPRFDFPAFPPGHRGWTGPIVSDTIVCVATSAAWSSDPAGDNGLDGNSAGHTCGNAGGALLCYDTSVGTIALSQSLTTTAVGGVRAYDGHLFVSSVNGAAAVFGKTGWNTTPPPPPGAKLGADALPGTSWTEP